MTHRAALFLSIALTLFLAIGVLIGRDRLFTAEAAVEPVVVTLTPAIVGDDALSGAARDVAGTEPRVIEIPLPVNPEGAIGGDRERTRDDRDDDHERDRFDDGDDHDEHDDDDDEEEHDDD
jgi:hypothetical protein